MCSPAYRLGCVLCTWVAFGTCRSFPAAVQRANAPSRWPRTVYALHVYARQQPRWCVENSRSIGITANYQSVSTPTGGRRTPTDNVCLPVIDRLKPRNHWEFWASMQSRHHVCSACSLRTLNGYVAWDGRSRANKRCLLAPSFLRRELFTELTN